MFIVEHRLIWLLVNSVPRTVAPLIVNMGTRAYCTFFFFFCSSSCNLMYLLYYYFFHYYCWRKRLDRPAKHANKILVSLFWLWRPQSLTRTVDGQHIDLSCSLSDCRLSSSQLGSDGLLSSRASEDLAAVQRVERDERQVGHDQVTTQFSIDWFRFCHHTLSKEYNALLLSPH